MSTVLSVHIDWLALSGYRVTIETAGNLYQTGGIDSLESALAAAREHAETLEAEESRGDGPPSVSGG